MNLRPLASLAFVLTLAAAAQAQSYTVTVIGGSTTFVQNISRDGTRTTGTQGGSVFTTNSSSVPYLLGAGQGYAITDFAEVAGTLSAPGGATHAAYWSGTSPFDLGTLGGSTSFATAINTSYGESVGLAYLPGNAVWHAFRYPLFGSMQDLGSLIGSAGKSEAYCITEEGVVLGNSENFVKGSLVSHACLWDTNNAMRDLDSLNPYRSTAHAATHSYLPMYLNGFTFTVRYTHAVGQYNTGPATSRARMWTTNNYSSTLTVQNLPALSSSAQYSVAYGINGNQVVVGYSDLSTPNSARACRWINGGVTNLNSVLINPPAGTVLTRALGISENGKIVAQGTINGSPRSFLLTPQ